MVESSPDAYRDIGGTTPWMGDDHTDVGGRAMSGIIAEIELRLEQQSRATHDYMDVEGRIASGTAIEEAKAERRPSSYLQDVGKGRKQER